jgi:hypothetical protein
VEGGGRKEGRRRRKKEQRQGGLLRQGVWGGKEEKTRWRRQDKIIQDKTRELFLRKGGSGQQQGAGEGWKGRKRRREWDGLFLVAA